MPSPDVSNYVDLTIPIDPSPSDRIAAALAPLVGAGTISESQADAISSALQNNVYVGGDLQPVEVYDAAIEYARSALPDWTPVAGSVEDALLQASADMTTQLLGAINRMPAGVVEGLLKLFGVERNSGTAPTGLVDITFVDDSGYTLAPGTRFGYLDSGGNTPLLYVFETTETVTVPVGSISETNVAVRGVLLDRYPALPTNTSLQLLSAISYIDSVVLSADLDPGAESETTAEYLNRGAAIFGTLSEALVLPDQFSRYILTNYTGFYRAKAWSRLKAEIAPTSIARASNVVTAVLPTEPALSVGDVVRVYGSTITGSSATFDGLHVVSEVKTTSPYHIRWADTGVNISAASTGRVIHPTFQSVDGETSEPNTNGYLMIYVTGVNGASVTASSLIEVEEELIDRSIAGLITTVTNAIVVDIDVAVTVTLKSGYLASRVTSNIAAALNEYLHPDHWDWNPVIHYNEIVSFIDKVEGVERVVELTLSGPAALTSVDAGSGDLSFTSDGLTALYGVLPRNTATITVST